MYLEVKGISKYFGKTCVLNNINLEMETGHIYGFWGRNGSGKTMLMRIISGLVFPSDGAIIIGGEQLGKDISFPRSIGALIENPGFIPGYSGFKNLKILASIQNKISDEDIREVMLHIGLDPDDRKKAKKYSLGMKQKLGIAAALMEKPDLILLDEPTNALDENSTKVLKEILLEHKRRGALLIVACHIREELEYLSDEIICLNEGHVIKRYVPDKTRRHYEK
ncbi:MAG: ATP-binding cassette domain-containing protein [Floccifex porci]|uniref:ATP-binding cassette domain-containing protein n=1 Tax=Floccifex porci TaxID=2606629 RepID=UPI003F1202D2